MILLNKIFKYLFEPPHNGETIVENCHTSSKITRGKIKDMVYKLAHSLASIGIGSTNTVALSCKNGANFIAGFFAPLLAGKKLLIGDFSSENTITQIEHEAGLLITDNPPGIDRTPNMQISTVDRLLSLSHSTKSAKLKFNFGENEDFVTLFTSGSTGEPKKIVKTARNILDELKILKSIHKTTPNDVYLGGVPWYHIYGMLNGLLLPIMEGARLIVVQKPSFFKIAKCLTKATVCILVPVQIKILTEITVGKSQSMRLCISSGSHLSAQLSNKFHKSTSVPILDIYGSTETGGIASRLTPGEALFSPFPSIKIKFDDEGQLLVKTPLKGKITGNTHQQDEEEFYPTGDYAQVGESNKFQLIGRKRQIIKAGGRRLSTVEIEEGLLKTGLIRDTVVYPYISKIAESEKLLPRLL